MAMGNEGLGEKKWEEGDAGCGRGASCDLVDSEACHMNTAIKEYEFENDNGWLKMTGKDR